MAQENLGNVVGVLRGTTPPTKPYVLWAKDTVTPGVYEPLRWFFDGQWRFLTDGLLQLPSGLPNDGDAVVWDAVGGAFIWKNFANLGSLDAPSMDYDLTNDADTYRVRLNRAPATTTGSYVDFGGENQSGDWLFQAASGDENGANAVQVRRFLTQLTGALLIGAADGGLDPVPTGTLQYNGSELQYYDGSQWVAVGAQSTVPGSADGVLAVWNSTSQLWEENAYLRAVVYGPTPSKAGLQFFRDATKISELLVDDTLPRLKLDTDFQVSGTVYTDALSIVSGAVSSSPVSITLGAGLATFGHQLRVGPLSDGTSAAEGMMAYDSGESRLHVYHGSAWNRLWPALTNRVSFTHNDTSWQLLYNNGTSDRLRLNLYSIISGALSGGLTVQNGPSSTPLIKDLYSETSTGAEYRRTIDDSAGTGGKAEVLVSKDGTGFRVLLTNSDGSNNATAEFNPNGAEFARQIKVGAIAAATPADGMIQYNSGHFLGRESGAWVRLGGYYREQAFSSSTSIAVNHNFGRKPIVQVLKNDNTVILPDTVQHTDENNLSITLSTSSTGIIICVA